MAVDKDMPILIADGHKTMLKLIRSLLGEFGFANVQEASGSKEAMEKLLTQKFALIISDWNLEPLTGLELLRRVRADAKLGKLPFIMLTAEAKADNVVAAKRAGVNDYIIKPFTAATLRARLCAVVGAF
jgi:two-component system chemotaxis response regulator CheY